MAVTANASTVRTGHGGKVMAKQVGGSDYYLIARLTQWSISLSRTEASWADSDSSGYTNRIGGRRDLTGSITGKLDKGSQAYNDVLFAVDDSDPSSNDMVILVLFEDGNEAVPASHWHIPRALITSYDMSFDSDSKEPVEWTANFGADGVFYKPGDGDAQTIVTAHRGDA